jgi:hypothetical protein
MSWNLLALDTSFYLPSFGRLQKTGSRRIRVVEPACLCADERYPQRAMKHVQDAHCGVYRLPLFQVVPGFLEQFSRTVDKYSFRFRNTIREFSRVGLANCRFVEVAPISVVWEFVSDSVHGISITVPFGRIRGDFYRRTKKLGHNGSLCGGCQIVARNRQPKDTAERC